jgi:hypothetical protein
MPLSEEQDKSRSGAVPIKGASIRHGKHREDALLEGRESFIPMDGGKSWEISHGRAF